MARITFSNDHALTAFLSMAEGMEEVQRDTGDADSLARAEALGRMLKASATTRAGVLFVEIEDRDAEEANAVIENCLDASAEYGDLREDAVEEHGEDASDCIYPGEATVALGEPAMIAQHPRRGDLDLRKAVRFAIATLSAAPAGSKAADAHDWLVELYQQHGCDHLGEDEDGLLENCQIFIRG